PRLGGGGAGGAEGGRGVRAARPGVAGAAAGLHPRRCPAGDRAVTAGPPRPPPPRPPPRFSPGGKPPPPPRPGAPPARRPRGPPPGAVQRDGVASVLFPPGSPGRPRGVLGPPRALTARCAHEPIPFGPGDVAALKTSTGFIDSLWELFAPALHGAPSVVVPAA